MQNWKFFLLISAALFLTLGSSAALADQLTLGSDGTLYFCSTGAAGSQIAIATSSACSSFGGTFSSGSTGSFEAPKGNLVIGGQPWSIAFPSDFRFGSLSGGNFSPSGSTSSFSWGAGSDLITGNITFTLVTDGTQSPRWIGQLLITGNANASGSLLKKDYPVGQTVKIDFNVDLGGNPSLDAVYNHSGGCPPTGAGACYTSGDFSSGEVPSVPEPVTGVLFGTGLIAVGTYLRRRKA